MSTSTPLLDVCDLHVAYGHVQAVRGVCLSVFPGQIVTLIGPNGAGKSSLLAAVAGLTTPQAGKVVFNGADLSMAKAHATVAAGLVLVPEGRAILARMTIAENLLLAIDSGPHALSAVERQRVLEEQYARFPVLGERRRALAGTLSGGEQQMLAMARGLAARPRLLMLDEPSMGLAPQLVAQIFATIAAIHADGVTILLVEQNARTALAVSDYAYVLERGTIALSGPAPQLAADPRVQHAYLGGDVDI
jgi:branched-chain amino acid transport system ATP-binding protein